MATVQDLQDPACFEPPSLGDTPTFMTSATLEGAQGNNGFLAKWNVQTPISIVVLSTLSRQKL